MSLRCMRFHAPTSSIVQTFAGVHLSLAIVAATLKAESPTAETSPADTSAAETSPADTSAAETSTSPNGSTSANPTDRLIEGIWVAESISFDNRSDDRPMHVVLDSPGGVNRVTGGELATGHASRMFVFIEGKLIYVAKYVLLPKDPFSHSVTENTYRILTHTKHSSLRVGHHVSGLIGGVGTDRLTMTLINPRGAPMTDAGPSDDTLYVRLRRIPFVATDEKRDQTRDEDSSVDDDVRRMVTRIAGMPLSNAVRQRSAVMRDNPPTVPDVFDDSNHPITPRR